MAATVGLRTYIRCFAKLPLTVSNAAAQCLETPFHRDCIANDSVFHPIIMLRYAWYPCFVRSLTVQQQTLVAFAQALNYRHIDCIRILLMHGKAGQDTKWIYIMVSQSV